MNLSQNLYEIKDGVALITLNRPEHLNAFTPVMREELILLIAESQRPIT